MDEAILALDLGTTACKAVVFDLSARELGAGTQEYPTHHPRPDAAEQDPEDWWRSAAQAARQALDAAPPVRIVAIGLAAQRETVVPVDGRGRPLRRAITWLDRRSQPQAEAMAAALGAGALHARTGMRPEATFSAPKVRWLAEHEPELLRQAAWLLGPKDYLIMRLTGAPATDPSVASRTLLWGIHGGWQDDLLAWAGLRPDQLPPVVPSGAVAGRLAAAAAGVLGLPDGTPVVAGAGDRNCEALGAGVHRDGRIMLSIGTAVNVSAALGRLPNPLAGGLLYTRHAVAGQWLAEQGISTGGSVLKWLRNTMGHAGYDALDQAAAGSPPGARGLVLLPFFMGARATRWNPAARGAWLGLNLGHGPGDLARSIMEGVACEVRACIEVLQQAGQPARELLAVGGGARSPLWCQIQADVTRCPVLLPRAPGGAALGAMLLAGQAAGLWPDPGAAALAANPPATRHDPAPDRSAFYDHLYQLYSDLYAAVAPLYGRLAQPAAAPPATPPAEEDEPHA